MKPKRAAEMSRGIQLVRAGPSETFHDLEVGHDTITPGVKARSGSKNELRRLTSLRKVITSGEFWESLPLLSKAFLTASCIDALLVIAFSIQQMAAGTNGELLHISLVMLLTSIFFLWFAWDAIVCENAFELIASAVLGLAVCARIIFFVAERGHNAADISVVTIALVLQILVLLFGYITWGQFGWRTYSKLAADMRIKNADEQRTSFVLVNCFMTLLKLDVQFLIILCMVGLDVGIQTGPGQPNNKPLIIVNSVGLIVMVVWSWLAYRAVKHEDRVLAWVLTVFLPIMYILPIVDIVLGYAYGNTAANAKETLIFSAILVVVVRTAVWAFMHVLQKRFEYVALQRQLMMGKNATPNGLTPAPTPHIELTPLMRGAWIGKPSSKAPKKRRFFQLSHDGSTLRWSWNKYVVMYYVEDIEAQDDDLQLTLKMALEPDLRLRFFDAAHYSTWKRGFETLQQLLFSPGGLTMDLADITDFEIAGDASERHDLVMQLASEGRQVSSPHNILGFRLSQRPSTADPSNQRVQAVAERARSGMLTGTNTATPSRNPSRTPSRVHSILEEAPGPFAAPVGLRQGHEPGRRGATMPVASLLEALNEGNDRTEPETFEEAQLGIKRTTTIPVKFKQLVSDCLSPSGSLRPGKHHKLSEVGNVDTPPARPMTPMEARLAEEEAQGQQAEGQASPKRLRVTPLESEQHQPAASQGGVAEGIDSVSPPMSPFGGDQLQAAAERTAVTDARFSSLQRLSGAASTSDAGTQQAGPPFSNGGPMQLPTPGAATRQQTPFAMTDTSYSQPGTSDVSANTQVSDGSWQPRPSIQGMALQMSVELIPYEELKWGRFLGRGAEGAVYAAWYLETPVAVKRPESKVEVEMNLHSGSHDNIVGLRGLCQHGDDLYLIMEYCPRGTLDVMLHHSAAARWDSAKLVSMVRSIARGMLHLHTRKPPMLHRDLKPGNIFVGHGLVMKIGDFGMSRQIIMRHIGDEASLERAMSANVIGTAVYAAPELLLADSPVKKNQVDAATVLKSDVYSFGVTLWQILERKRPFEGMEAYQVSAQWIMGAEVQLPPVTIPEGLSEDSKYTLRILSQMVVDCTQFEAQKRPSFRQIVDVLRRLSPGGGTLGDATDHPPSF
ncbi:hypothetical protein WJX77_000076 [Trebouxia sp. C0004]